MMAALLLYAYCVGLPSSRRIEQVCWEDAAFRVLTGDQQPDYSRISAFRHRHLEALDDLLRSGAAALPKGGAVEPGPGGAGWHQDQSECQQAQGP